MWDHCGHQPLRSIGGRISHPIQTRMGGRKRTSLSTPGAKMHRKRFRLPTRHGNQNRAPIQMWSRANERRDSRGACNSLKPIPALRPMRQHCRKSPSDPVTNQSQRKTKMAAQSGMTSGFGASSGRQERAPEERAEARALSRPIRQARGSRGSKARSLKLSLPHPGAGRAGKAGSSRVQFLKRLLKSLQPRQQRNQRRKARSNNRSA
jgi:hypothetical protein